MVDLKEVARNAEVSVATASLAINDSSLVNQKTKEKVKKIADQLGYIPNIYAQKLAKGKSYNICIMLNSLYFFKSPNIYYLRVIGGIIRQAETTGYTISFKFYGSEQECELSSLKAAFKNVDGIIIFDVIHQNILDFLLQTVKKPVLLIDNHKLYDHIFGVDNDDFGGAYKATQYLISLGHRKIGFIGLPDSHPLGAECWKGFKKAMQESSLQEFFVYRQCKFGIRSGKKAIEVLFEKSRMPSAFFCMNDYIAIGVIEQLKTKGYKVPDDFSIIGMDDMEISSEIDPPLTTIKIKMEELGEIGIKKIIGLINGEYRGKIKTIIGNDLIIRQSCKEVNR